MNGALAKAVHFSTFEKLGEDEVRLRLIKGGVLTSAEEPYAEFWLEKKSLDRAKLSLIEARRLKRIANTIAIIAVVIAMVSTTVSVLRYINKSPC
jgi:hypothetical protein